MTRMTWLPAGSVKLTGEIGKMLEKSIRNRLCTMDYKKLVEPFHLRYENDGAWRGEFWGKNIRGAMLSCYVTGDKELAALLKASVDDMLSAQTPDGCISSYPYDKQLTGWDIWGRKYALIGLIRYYRLLEQDPRIPVACARALDFLINQLREKNLQLKECGRHEGLAACSILGDVVDVYRLTQEKRFLDFAVEIVESGCSMRHNIFEEVLKGTLPCDLGNGKAYEMMSCFQGLAQLQEFIPNPKWHEVVTRFFKMVAEHELFVTGAAGCRDRWGEFWAEGNFMQTDNDMKHTGGLGETCVTVTWLHYCNEILRLCGDAAVPKYFERTAFNAILGGTDDTAVLWVHRNPTPLAGPSHKVHADDQIGRGFGTPFDGHDCCRAQGPEGLAMLPALALMQGEGESAPWYMNLYESMETPYFTMEGTYPFGGDALKIVFTKEMPRPLCLNILPDVACVKLDGKELPIQPDTYLTVADAFKPGQVIDILFDTAVKAERRGNLVALTAGPLVLAQDSRIYGRAVGTPLQGCHFDFKRIEARPGFRACFQNCDGRILCDYASADSTFQQDIFLQVWHDC